MRELIDQLEVSLDIDSGEEGTSINIEFEMERLLNCLTLKHGAGEGANILKAFPFFDNFHQYSK